jgi:hypothetical protein
MSKEINVKKLNIYQQGHALSYEDILKIKNEHARNRAFKKRSELLYNASNPIKPNRYVWHLSPAANRESIFEKGILPGQKSNLIFVNNQIEMPHHLWPILGDDGWYMHQPKKRASKDTNFGFSDIELYYDTVYSEYDFWRIDSNIAGYDGYRIDPFKPADGLLDNAEWDSAFLARNKFIPTAALTLFRYLRFSMPEYDAFRLKRKKEFVYPRASGTIRVSRFDKSKPCYLVEYKPLIQKIAA